MRVHMRTPTCLREGTRSFISNRIYCVEVTHPYISINILAF